MLQVNLIPAPLRQAKAKRKRVTVWACAIAGYAVLLVAGLCVYTNVSSADAGQIDRQSAGADEQLARANLTVGQLQGRLTETQRELQLIYEIGRQPDCGILLAVLAANMRDNIVLERCRLMPEELASSAERSKRKIILELSGFAQSQIAVSQFVLRLENTDLFKRVSQRTSREEFLGDDVVAFHLNCVLDGGQSERP